MKLAKYSVNVTIDADLRTLQNSFPNWSKRLNTATFLLLLADWLASCEREHLNVSFVNYLLV